VVPAALTDSFLALVQHPAGEEALRDRAEASRVPEKSGLKASGDASLNKPFQLKDLALEVRAVLDA
jgi:hypothetical protein